MKMPVFVDSPEGKRAALELRKSLLLDGRPLRPLPSDLERYNLFDWEGTYLGMECEAESPIIVVKR